MKQSIYVDTSVISAYFDDRIPYQRDTTLAWWETAPLSYNLLLSEVVLEELERAQGPKREKMLGLVNNLPVLAATEEVAQVAFGYVERGIVPEKYMPDALHIAYATCYRAEYLVTWNCSHLANVRKRRAVALFNTSAGLFVPEMVTPEFFQEEEEDA